MIDKKRFLAEANNLNDMEGCVKKMSREAVISLLNQMPDRRAALTPGCGYCYHHDGFGMVERPFFGVSVETDDDGNDIIFIAGSCLDDGNGPYPDWENAVSEYDDSWIFDMLGILNTMLQQPIPGL